MIFLRMGGFSTGKAAHVGELKAYVQPVEKISLPQDKKSLHGERQTTEMWDFSS